MELRNQFNTALFGTNRTGKTTLMLKVFTQYMEVNEGKRGLFILPDGSESKYDSVPEIKLTDIKDFEGICKVYFNGSDKKQISPYEIIFNEYTAKDRQFNGIIQNDDMGIAFDRRPQDIINLSMRRRQTNIDMLWNFHGLTTDMPKVMFRYLTGLVLFRTEDDYKDTMMKLSVNKRKMFEEAYFNVQAISNGVTLDMNGNMTDDPLEAMYNKKGEKNPFYYEEVA